MKKIQISDKLYNFLNRLIEGDPSEDCTSIIESMIFVSQFDKGIDDDYFKHVSRRESK